MFVSICGTLVIGAKGNSREQADYEKLSRVTKSRTDWARVDALTDETIDYSDIPAPEADFWRDAVKYDPVKLHAPD